MEFEVTVRSDKKEHLAPAVALCFAHDTFSHREATHYKTLADGSLLLLWHDDTGAAALPYVLTVETAADFIKGWLRQRTPFAWPKAPDADGDVVRGWELSTETGNFYGVLKLSLAWVVYGK